MEKKKVSNKAEKASTELKTVDVNTLPDEVTIEVINDSKHLKKGEVHVVGKDLAVSLVERGFAIIK